MKKIQIVSIIAIVLIISGTFWVMSSRTVNHQSDVISRAAPEVGPRAHILLPNLKNAHLVVPDRPHDPSEVFREDKAEKITRVREFYASTNTMGFRSPELAEPKSKPRILCIGDSVTFGWGVDDSETYPALLQKRLPNTEVINVGVPALKPEHVLRYVNIFIDTVQPDLVLLAMRPNWMTPNALQSYTQTIKQLQNKVKPAKLGVILPPIASFDPKGRAQEKQEVSAIRRSLNKLPLLDLTPIFDQNMPKTGVKLVQEGNLQKMVSRIDGTVVAQGNNPLPPQALAEEIIQQFEQDSDIKEPLFFDGGHPDAEGFILFADALASWLQEEALVTN